MTWRSAEIFQLEIISASRVVFPPFNLLKWLMSKSRGFNADEKGEFGSEAEPNYLCCVPRGSALGG